jgi:hypothetical protein
MRRRLAAATVLGATLAAHTAGADVVIAKKGSWEVFSRGRVNAFVTYATGDAPPPGTNFVPGGGFDVLSDGIPGDPVQDIDPDTGQPVLRPGQGTIRKWRVRSGYVPNVLGFGVRSSASDALRVSAYLGIWGTIETEEQLKFLPVLADFREGWGKVEGHWGGVHVGRQLTLFARGVTDLSLRYGHQYGVGSHVAQQTVTNTPQASLGPTGGLVGYGVLGATYSAGIYYSTPRLLGFQLHVGVFDPVTFSNSWTRSTTPRPEAEISYEYGARNVLLEATLSGAYQQLAQENQPAEISEEIWGATAALRGEYGPYRLGIGAYVASGSGLWYAFAGNGNNGQTNFGPAQLGVYPGTTETAAGPEHFAPRIFRGASVFLQFAPGAFDVNVGAGRSMALQLNQDRIGFFDGAPVTDRNLIKYQTGIFGAFVYHIDESLHAAFDVMHAMFEWHGGETQDDTFFNLGATIDW